MGDPIRAVIRGTAINENRRTGGITYPSPDGQEAVLRGAYERVGGLDLDFSGYFECHRDCSRRFIRDHEIGRVLQVGDPHPPLCSQEMCFPILFHIINLLDDSLLDPFNSVEIVPDDPDHLLDMNESMNKQLENSKKLFSEEKEICVCPSHRRQCLP